MSQVDEPVVIATYNPAWPAWYEAEASRLREQLTDEVAGIEHIGSTAVSRLRAKPIIDIMVGIENFANAEALAPKLSSLGYEDCGGAPGRRYFRRRGEHSYNVQIVEHKSDLWNANVVFRNYLRTHPDACHEYADLKTRSVEASPTLLAYSAAKSDGLAQLMHRARASREPDL